MYWRSCNLPNQNAFSIIMTIVETKNMFTQVLDPMQPCWVCGPFRGYRVLSEARRRSIFRLRRANTGSRPRCTVVASSWILFLQKHWVKIGDSPLRCPCIWDLGSLGFNEILQASEVTDERVQYLAGKANILSFAATRLWSWWTCFSGV
jgi:hypothetical protein